MKPRLLLPIFCLLGMFWLPPQANPQTDLSQIVVSPNPLRPALGHTVMTFSKLPPNARIRIYSYLGELLKDLSADALGKAPWDGTNQSGQMVASGVYFACIESQHGTKTKKMVLMK